MRLRVPTVDHERGSSASESIARTEFRAGDIRKAITDAIENHVRVRQSAGIFAIARALVLLDEHAPRAVRPFQIGVTCGANSGPPRLRLRRYALPCAPVGGVIRALGRPCGANAIRTAKVLRQQRA